MQTTLPAKLRPTSPVVAAPLSGLSSAGDCKSACRFLLRVRPGSEYGRRQQRRLLCDGRYSLRGTTKLCLLCLRLSPAHHAIRPPARKGPGNTKACSAKLARQLVLALSAFSATNGASCCLVGQRFRGRCADCSCTYRQGQQQLLP